MGVTTGARRSRVGARRPRNAEASVAGDRVRTVRRCACRDGWECHLRPSHDGSVLSVVAVSRDFKRTQRLPPAASAAVAFVYGLFRMGVTPVAKSS